MNYTGKKIEEELDPKVLKVMKAIRLTETGNSIDAYTAKGDAGTSTGAFQFQDKTWKEWARKHLKDENAPKTKGNQNYVAYQQIKEFKDKGYSPIQVAAAWNAGEGSLKNDAWKNKVGTTTINGQKIRYDTPSYVNKFTGFLSGNTPQSQQKYYTPDNVVETPEQRQKKMAQYQTEQTQLDAEAKKANSIGGFLSNFGKSFVENIAPSEVGLGKTIAKLDSKPRNSYLEGIQTMSATQANLIKTISENEKLGKDTTKLKQIYNENIKQLETLQAGLDETNDLPSNQKALGQIGGTALDVLTAGQYGKATTGMAGGKLAIQGKNSFAVAKALDKVKIGNTIVKPTTSLTTKIATGAGLPELGKIGQQKATGILTKKGALNVAKGAGIGYGFDVTQGLQGLRGEDREGNKAFIPGLGTAIGAGIPAISETTQSVKNIVKPELKANKLIQQRKTELDKLDRLQTLKKTTEKGRERGIDVKKVLSETDVLHGSVDKTGNISTKGKGGAVEQYTKEFIDGNEAIVSDVLKKEGKSIAPGLIKQKLNKAVMDAGIEGKALVQARKAIDDELAGYSLRASQGGAIPLDTLHKAKIDKYNNINFFTESNTKKYDKTVAKALKELVETHTTNTDVKNINKELSKHFAVIDYLEKLDGRKVDGGKLGKYFAQTVGAIVGSHFGPVGAIVGAEAGGRLKGNLLSRVFSGKTGKTFPQAKAITDALEYKKAPPLELQSSNNLGNRQTNQAITNIPTKNPIPPIIPPKNVKGKK